MGSNISTMQRAAGTEANGNMSWLNIDSCFSVIRAESIVNLTGPAATVRKAQKEIDDLQNVNLSIAVTGETGSGKSTFINAIRGLSDDDEGAAPTGVTETTMKPEMYQHPRLPNVKIWDLPGIGGTFDAKNYLKKVNFHTYDFFIIITASRFKENDLKLAKEIMRKKKSFYMVRSKIDMDIHSEKRKGRTEEEVLRKIKEDSQHNLKVVGNPPVFLICSYALEKYDFEDLIQHLLKELPGLKRAVLRLLPVSSMEILQQKYELYRGIAWAAFIVANASALAPVPCLNNVLNVTFTVGFLTWWYFDLGLDDRSLQKMSDRLNMPELRDISQKQLLTSALRKKCIQVLNLDSVREPDTPDSFVESVILLLTGLTNSPNVIYLGLELMYEMAKEVLEQAELR
ncbi:T-cell-specific guanine nucleotide triphosphate-binding protein 1-like [Denticeps clupeoides]|uniref:T-cell-specific guanine nucleotide triphosphate-binding protein 1-like n=1 Tax=Denticeps clupeoides TaxID=299321 RepID=UPI0010A392B7|nr:T-cell-specific guanine nucleotide triphosphate-binding protein 1-like [Denticeps clupeoides]